MNKHVNEFDMVEYLRLHPKYVEHTFIQSVYHWFRVHGKLTEKQRNVVEKMYYEEQVKELDV